ncbi:unnamed protein product, partial [Rotaria sp. Silwood2]
LLKSFDRFQLFPIRSTRKDMRKLVEYLLHDADQRSTSINIIQHYSTLLEWIRIRWIFDDYLTDSIRDALQKDVSITRYFIVECELKYSCWELSKTISKIIEDTVSNLPIESSTLNNQYLEAENKIKNILNAIEICEKQIEGIKTLLNKQINIDDIEGIFIGSTQKNCVTLARSAGVFR